jgi:hypothetical protein
MHFLFSLLRIKGLYIFRALLAHPQEALHKRHLVYCWRVMSVGCPGWSGTGGLLRQNNKHAIYQVPFVKRRLRMNKYFSKHRKVKVKQSHYRLMRPEGSGRLRLPDSMTSALEGSRLSALHTGRYCTPRSILVLIFQKLNRPRLHGIVGCHGKNLQ